MLLIFKLAAATPANPSSATPPHPSSFPSLAKALTPQELTARIKQIKDFFGESAGGDALFHKVYPEVPTNPRDYNTRNLKNEYTAWYNAKFAVSGAATEQIAEERRKAAAAEQLAEQTKTEAEENERKILLEAEQKERALVLQHREAQERTIATHQASMVAILAGGGGNFTDAQVNDLVTAISEGEHIQVNGMAFDDDTKSVDVSATINGTERSLNVTNLPQAEYNRLKLFLGIFAKMHSAAFNAASGAMSDLITDILSSAQPQDYHFSQIAQLASTRNC